MSSRTRHKQCEGSLAFEHLDRDSSFHFVPFRMTSHREGYIAWLCSEPRPMVECEESLCHPEPDTDGVRDLLFLTRNGGDCSLAWQEMLRYAQHDIRLGGVRFFGVLPLRMTAFPRATTLCHSERTRGIPCYLFEILHYAYAAFRMTCAVLNDRCGERDGRHHAPKSSYISISEGTPRSQSIFFTALDMGPGPHI